MSAECSAEDIPPGYKQTEVGVIPEDWCVLPLEAFLSFISYGFTNPMPTSASGVHMITAKDINGGRIQFETARCTTEEAYRTLLTDKSRAKNGDLLLTKDGTLGRLALVDGRRICINQSVAVLRPNSRADAKFLKVLLEAPQYQSRMLEDAGGSTIKHIYITIVNQMPISVPLTKAEQEAITEALSDADAFIESLEQLIAKKRQIKQGAMQELLRPKDGWKLTSLGNIADPNQRWSFTGGPFGSNLKSSDYTDDGIRIIQLQNIGDGEFKGSYEVYTSIEKADELLSCNIYPGEIILSKMGDPVARACIIPPHKKRYLMCSDGIRLAVDQKRFNTYFVYTLINAPEFRMKAENASTGSTRKRIGLTELRNLELLCPPLSEQNAISAILSDMDSEITALEEKLAKARHLKQGMMQELLTGRIRLI